MTLLGYQIPSFTYPGRRPEELFPTVARQAREAEASGFDTVLVMDHFYQLPTTGLRPDDYMLEGYTVLAALARETTSVRLGTLVTGNTYRNPAVLAKIVSTLDIVSGGRAQLGIGTGWFELEHRSFGIDFGTTAERFEKLDEALKIVVPMLRGERVTFHGRHYQVTDALSSPAPIGRIPVMIGGGGEHKTLRMVAQYADESNLIAERIDVPRKLDALADHCDRVGRDRTEITVSWLRAVCVAPTAEQAEEELDAGFRLRGIDLRSLADDDRAALTRRVITGDPDSVGEALAADLALGVDGFTINAPLNGHVPERVALIGETVGRLMRVR